MYYTVRYNASFIITEFVIIKFDCIEAEIKRKIFKIQYVT